MLSKYTREDSKSTAIPRKTSPTSSRYAPRYAESLDIEETFCEILGSMGIEENSVQYIVNELASAGVTIARAE